YNARARINICSGSRTFALRDGSICGNGCWRPEGCSRNFNALSRTICPVCKMGTYSDTGICSTHSGPYD
ncbi:8251_t:CDS:2, partial [Racocetra persica]